MPNGDVHQATQYETRTAIKENIPLNDQLTFYVRHGDYLARIAVGLAAVALLFFIFLIIKNKRTIHH
jgi:apolipoprotein N-acyltransferase